MNDSKKLSKKQLAVIDEIFAGELNEEQICTKLGITKARYHKWLADNIFKSEFIRRIEWLNIQSRILIARHSSAAAAKLIELIDSEKEEIRRKACLDILSLHKENNNGKNDSEPNTDNTNECSEIPGETASKLLAALAHS